MLFKKILGAPKILYQQISSEIFLASYIILLRSSHAVVAFLHVHCSRRVLQWQDNIVNF